MTKAICKSSAAIDPAWVKTYRSNGWEGEAVATMDGLGVKLYSPGGALREAWIVGQREILEFADVPVVVSAGPITVTQAMSGNMPQVGEKPIDWSKFLPTADDQDGFVDIRLRGAPSGDGYSLPPGTVFASRRGEDASVRVMDGNWHTGNGATIALAGRQSWASEDCRIIRHADGTWAPGYGPDGPIIEATPPAVVSQSGAKFAGLNFYGVSPAPFIFYGGDKKPATAELAIENSVVAKLPDPPRGDSHRTIEHLKPRWKTPAYEAPGRWRR